MRSLPSNDPVRHQLLFPLVLIAAILVVYYPAVMSGLHPVDDTGIVAFYNSSPSLTHLLTPGTGYYYRPFVELSFWLDSYLWDMEPAMLHLENILLHCLNCLLVFRISRRIIRCSEPFNSLLPCGVALFFALHPLQVEPVAWIAGRPELLLTLWVLGATVFWLNWLEQGRWYNLVATLMLFLLALLSKETAFAFGGVLLMSTLCLPGRISLFRQTLVLFMAALPAFILLLWLLLLRHEGFSGLGRFLGGNWNLTEATLGALAAAGFYVKKLVLPLPLNFAVDQVSRWYLVVAVVVVLLLIQLLRRDRRVAFWYLAALLMLCPALLLAVKPIAWTPVAERYLYLSSAFFCIGVVASLDATDGPVFKRYGMVLLSVVALGGILSFQRVLLWKDKQAFFEDAIVKSPDFGSLYNELGAIVFRQGNVERAEELFAIAEKLNRRDSIRMAIKTNRMSVLYAKGNYDEVREQFFRMTVNRNDASPELLELLHKADSKRLLQLAGRERSALAADLLLTLEVLYRKRPDPFWLYRSGQVALFAGERIKAADFFQQAHVSAPIDAHYRGAAATYLKKLGAR